MAVENTFSRLLLAFREQLLNRISLIEDLWLALSENNTNIDIVKQFEHTNLRLADVAGTFGANEISYLSRKIFLNMKPYLDEGKGALFFEIEKEATDKLLKKLKLEATDWLATDITEEKIFKKNTLEKSVVIYTLLENKEFENELSTYFGKYGYEVKEFNTISDVDETYEKERPVAIVIDDGFIGGEVKGIDVAKSLTKDINIPVIFIADSDEIEYRLDISRSGVKRYFTNPVTAKTILRSIKSLNADLDDLDDLAYRVMIVDNDQLLLECYDVILSEENIVSKAISDPLKAYHCIEKFKPDVIVVDMHMPICSGLDIVNMIKQDERWSLIPLIFLSGEQDINSQLHAMSLGADDFVVKPVSRNKLIATVNANAKRARKNVKLSYDLKNALRNNKAQVETLNQHAIVSETDIAGRILNVNDKFCEISGYSYEELLGENHRLIKSERHDENFYKELWRCISNGKIWHGEICNQNKNGDEYWVESTIVPFLDENEKPYKYVSVRTDVTALRVSEYRFKQSQQFANIGTWDWNILTGDLFWSDKIWSLFGYDKSVDHTSYDNFIAAIHPDDRNKVSNAVTDCIEKNKEYSIEHRVVWPDGSIHWLHESGDVIRNKAGTPLHMLGVVRDITEIKEAEIWQRGNNLILEMIVMGKPLTKILETIILHVETIMPTARCSILLLDPTKKYFEHNVGPSLPSFYNDAINGLEIGMGVGSCGEAAFTSKRVIVSDIMTHPNWVNFKALAQKAELHACWSEPFSSSTGDTMGTFAIYFPDKKVPNNNNINLLVEIAHFAAIAVEREQSQKAVIQAKEDAEEANLAKSQFLSSMSHELRTPMNAIMGFSQLLKISKKEILTEYQESNVNEIMTAGKHLMSLINEVLDLSKIETGNIDLSISKVQLSKVIVESLQLIEPLAKKRGIEILVLNDDKKIIMDDLIKEQFFVYTDETRLKQVLLNLLSNAVKYNYENGKITLHCNKGINDKFRVCVKDTGGGLSAEQQKKLFKPFNRLALDKTEVEGTGIGLVITKKIVELMGGRIWLESEVGIGSEFFVELPINDEKKYFDMDVNNNEILVKKCMSDTGKEKSVLYIEDNPANLRLVEQILDCIPNIKMWSAPEPMLGLELALEHLPDLILLDINLPGMDGYEVLQKIKSNAALKDIPVVAISANAMPKDLGKGKKAGFKSYITKPVNVKELLSAVEEQLGLK